MTQPKMVRTARALELADEGRNRPEFVGLNLSDNQRNMVKNRLRDGQFLNEADPVRAAYQSVLNKSQQSVYEAPAPGEIYTPRTAVDEIIRVQSTGAEPSLELQQFQVNYGPELEAEFVRRQQEAAPPAPAPVGEEGPAPVAEEEPTPAPVAEEEPTPAPVAEEEPTPVGEEGPAPVAEEPTVGRETYVPKKHGVKVRDAFTTEVLRVAKDEKIADPNLTRVKAGQLTADIVQNNGGFVPTQEEYEAAARKHLGLDKAAPTSAPVTEKPAPASVAEEASATPTPAPIPTPIVEDPAPASTESKKTDKPFVKYGSDGLAFSASVPEAVRNTIQGWKRLILSNTKLYIVDMGDIQADKPNYTGPYRKLASAALNPENLGLADKLADGEYYIAVDSTKLADDPQALLEVIAHEMGHVHDKVEFQNASPGVQQALRAAHRKWVVENVDKDKTAADLVKALRAPAMGARTTVDNIPASDLGPYWSSFNEWYADNMAKWATSSEKPLSVVDKFFKSVVDKLRKFYRAVTNKGYLPDETFKQFVESTTKNLDLSDTGVTDETDAVEAADQELEAGRISLDDFDAIKKASDSGKFSNEKLLAELRRRKKKYAENNDTASFAKDKAGADKKVEDAEKGISKSLKKVRAANDDRGIAEGLGEAAEQHGLGKWLPSIKTSDLGPEAGNVMRALPLDGLIEWAETKFRKQFPEGAKKLKEIEELIQKKTAQRGTWYRTLKPVLDAQQKFIEKYGRKALAEARHFARETSIDLAKLTGLEGDAALKTDDVWKHYTDALAEVETKLKGKKLNAKDKRDLNKRKSYLEGRRAGRATEIRDAVELWKALGEQRGGHELYIKIRQAYRDLYDIRRNALLNNLKRLAKNGVLPKDVLLAYQLEQEKISSRTQAPPEGMENKAYPDVPLGLFSQEYFPLGRGGKYGLRVRKGFPGLGNEPWFGTYDTKRERDAALREISARMGVDPTNRDFFELSSDVEGDYDGSGSINTAVVFKKSMQILRNVPEGEQLTAAQKRKIEAELYQLYVMSTPSGSLKANFLKAKKRAGYDNDLSMVDGTAFMNYSREIPQVTYGPQIQNEISAARSMLDIKDEEGSEPVAITAQEAELFNTFLNEIENRVNTIPESENEALGKYINPLSHLTYLSFLTTPFSAFLNFVSLPVRVMPSLYAEYGAREASAASSKWMTFISGTSIDKDNKILTLADTNAVKANPLLKRVMEKAKNEWGLFDPLSAFVITGRRDIKPGAAATASKVGDFVSRAMTYLFDSSERLTREAAFLSAFELEYARLKGADMTQAAREDAAIRKAKDIVYATLGNYNSYNRIPFMAKNALARALFQFKMFAVVQTKFFVSNFRTLFLRSDLNKGEKKAAAKELFGVLSATWLVAGVTGFPLWSIGMLALKALGWADADPDDDDYYTEFEDNPEAYIKYVWAPNTFGEPGFTTLDGRERTLGEMLLYGPTATLTGADISSRTSLDLPRMWFHSDTNGDDWKAELGDGLLNNIPFVSNLAGMADGIVTAMDGDVARGLERALPLAVARSAMKGARLATEGDITNARRPRLSQDEIETADIIYAIIGVNPLEIAERQGLGREIYNTEQGYASEKADISQRLGKVLRDQYYNTAPAEDVEERLEDIRKEIADFNSRSDVPPRLRFKGDYLGQAMAAVRRANVGDRGGVSMDEAAGRRYQDLFEDLK